MGNIVMRKRQMMNTLASPGRVASLYHELFDIAMEEGPVINTACTQSKEIFRCHGSCVTENFDLHITIVSVESNSHTL